MHHYDRTWCVTPVESAEELARKLTTIVWTCCTAFELGGSLWLKGACSGPSACEYDGRHLARPLAHGAAKCRTEREQGSPGSKA